MSVVYDKSSKALSGTDDSGAQLLRDLLDGDSGRNFDVDSIFAYEKDGKWGWVIFEFLRRGVDQKVTVESSHPNRYFADTPYRKGNAKKFLSLWALVKSLRHSGFETHLYLLNYDDNKKQIKEMRVKDVVKETDEKWVYNERETEYKNHVVTDDKLFEFDDFKKKFRGFNNDKKGETWEIIEYIEGLEKK